MHLVSAGQLARGCRPTCLPARMHVGARTHTHTHAPAPVAAPATYRYDAQVHPQMRMLTRAHRHGRVSDTYSRHALTIAVRKTRPHKGKIRTDFSPRLHNVSNWEAAVKV